MPRKSATWETALLPPQGRHAVDFFARKIQRLRPGSNPRSWVPEASMVTTRPPKPLMLFIFIKKSRNKSVKKIISNFNCWHVYCHSGQHCLPSRLLTQNYKYQNTQNYLFNPPYLPAKFGLCHCTKRAN